jgi:hypothetical protein
MSGVCSIAEVNYGETATGYPIFNGAIFAIPVAVARAGTHFAD